MPKIASTLRHHVVALMLSLPFGLLLLGPLQTAHSTPLYDGLVAYWDFSGDANDLSGNGLDGTINGAVEPAADRFGNTDSAYLFARGGFIDVPGDSRLQITGPLTINAWVNYYGLYSNARVLSFGPDHNGYELWVGNGSWGTTYGRPEAYVGNKGIGAGMEITPDEWHMLTVVVDPGTGMEFWIDGALANSVATGPASFNYFGNLNIGRKATRDFDAWYGLLDDIMIYDRALTSSDITTLYALNASLPAPPVPGGSIPEPGTLPLIALAGLATAGIRSRKRKQLCHR